MTDIISTDKSDVILNTYALARASWLEDDFISSFLLMAVSLINKQGYEEIKSDIFEKDFESEYGIIIPSQPTIKLLATLQKKDYIHYDDNLHLWKPNRDKIGEIDLSERRMQLSDGITKVVESITNYASSKWGEKIDCSEATEALYSFIQANSSKILNGDLGGYYSSYKTRSLIGSFIIDTKETDLNLFKTIKQITIGRLLVDALTIGESELKGEDFKNSEIYLDTRFFLNLIGFYGEYRENASANLVKKIIDQKANLLIFKHTYDEINIVLTGCAKWIDSPAYDPEKASSALRYLKSCGKDKRYVESLVAGITEKLKRYSIEIDTSSLISENHKCQIDRESLTGIIKDCYEHNDIIITERIKETIEYDVNSIQAIYYKRNGLETYNINEKTAFLLTSNRNLVFSCKKYHDENYTKNTIPATISDVFLGTYVWARAGISLCEEVLTNKIIADCYTAMEPTQYAINKFCSHIAELKQKGEITEAEVIALKCYGLQTQAIQPLLVNPNEYDYKDLHDVIEEIRQSTIATEKKKFDEEKTNLQNQISNLTEKYGITEKEFIKYRDMALRFQKEEKEKNDAALSEMISFAKKADDRLKIIPDIVNFSFNIVVQIILCFVLNSWINIVLRFAIPIFSVILCLAFHFNWFSLKDRIKLWLVFSYKKALQNKKIKDNIKGYLNDASTKNSLKD